MERWFTAADESERTAAVEALAAAAARGDARALTSLIELLHFARHPRARIPLLRALGRCWERTRALPALHAELDAPDPEVVRAAIEAIGAVGLPYGGAIVARWLEAREPETLPPELRTAALVALGRTHPALAETHAARLHREGLVDPAALHLALAEACSPALLEDPADLLEDPEDAMAALLHLAAAGPPDLHERVGPLRAGAPTALALVADRVASHPPARPEDEVLEVLVVEAPPPVMRRMARRLRRHPPATLLAAFEAAWAGVPGGGDERRHALRSALRTCVPELQDAALEAAHRAGPDLLAQVLQRVHADTPGLRRRLPELLRHPDERVAAAAVRAWGLTRPQAALEALDHLWQSPRAALRLEWIRLQQGAWRDHRRPEGPTSLPFRLRERLRSRLADLARHDADDRVREQALFAMGNLGFTAAAGLLVAFLAPEHPWRLRRAAAASLGEFPVPRAIEPMRSALEREDSEEVRFRLALALVRAADGDPRPRPALARSARRLLDGGPRERCLGLALLGAARDPTAVPILEDAAGPRRPATEGDVAVTALGRIGDVGGLTALVRATNHPSALRRLRAAEALARVGGPHAADRLVDLASDAAEHRDVRLAALAGLRALAPAPGTLERLVPGGPEDPLLFEIVDLRRTLDEGPDDLETVDARLAKAAPGFDPASEARRHPEAVRALRTAEYLASPENPLPAGLDAAPAPLLWTKGLELWMHGLLRRAWGRMRRTAARRALREVASRWDALRPLLAPAWPEGPGTEPYGGLERALQQVAERRNPASRVGSLREAAAALLVFDCDHPVDPALPHAVLGLPATARSRLAHDLYALGRLRNPLAHERSAHPRESARIRRFALGIVARLVASRGPETACAADTSSP